MATQASRRAFLRGNFGDPEVLRPPGAAESGFERACTGCGDCVTACPEAIIRADARGGVLLDLSLGACTFCGDCARACPTAALSEARMGDWPWRASVSSACLSLNGVACRTCEDACEPRAIRFRLELGGRARPVIDDEACTGCGACIAICPAGAVSLDRVTRPETEKCA